MRVVVGVVNGFKMHAPRQHTRSACGVLCDDARRRRLPFACISSRVCVVVCLLRCCLDLVKLCAHRRSVARSEWVERGWTGWPSSPGRVHMPINVCHRMAITLLPTTGTQCGSPANLKDFGCRPRYAEVHRSKMSVRLSRMLIKRFDCSCGCGCGGGGRHGWEVIDL